MAGEEGADAEALADAPPALVAVVRLPLVFTIARDGLCEELFVEGCE